MGVAARLMLLCGIYISAGSAGEASAKETYLDLTYPFDDRTVYWPTARPFKLEIVHRGMTEAGFYYEANRFSADEHGGTHIDAPSHFAKGRWTVDQVPLDQLIGQAVVIDISDKAKQSADAQLLPGDLTAFEARRGRIGDGSILLVRTGWGRFWPDRKRYLGTDQPGDVKNLHFPGISPAAAEWLVRNRRGAIKAVGIDTPSVDYGQSRDFRTHVILYKENIPGLENVANLDRLPERGATVYALPMKIAGGSGAPLRMVARLP
jgi:kynurenine formamidase